MRITTSRGRHGQRRITCITALLVALCAAALTTSARADWPNFRGPNHNGVSAEKGVATRWKTEPKALWSFELGSGFSSFACVGDTVYTAGTRGGKQVLYALSIEDGSERWSLDIERDYVERQGGDGPRATPSVSDGLVYMLGARGTLVCVDAKTGKRVWEQKLAKMPRWGYSGSVLVDESLAIVAAGESTRGLVAFDAKTGKEVWAVPDDDAEAGYSTPYPFMLGGRRFVAAFLGRALIVVAEKTGKLAWSLPWRTSYDVNAASVIVEGNALFVSSGYGHGAALYRLKPGKSGTIEGTKVWENKSIRAKFQSPVLLGKHLYTSDEKGMTCVELASGKAAWTIPREKHATIVPAAGQLIVLSERGELRVGAISPKGFRPSATAKVLDGRCWTVSTLHEGKLFVRNLTKMRCLDLSN